MMKKNIAQPNPKVKPGGSSGNGAKQALLKTARRAAEILDPERFFGSFRIHGQKYGAFRKNNRFGILALFDGREVRIAHDSWLSFRGYHFEYVDDPDPYDALCRHVTLLREHGNVRWPDTIREDNVVNLFQDIRKHYVFENAQTMITAIQRFLAEHDSVRGTGLFGHAVEISARIAELVGNERLDLVPNLDPTSVFDKVNFAKHEPPIRYGNPQYATSLRRVLRVEKPRAERVHEGLLFAIRASSETPIYDDPPISAIAGGQPSPPPEAEALNRVSTLDASTQLNPNAPASRSSMLQRSHELAWSQYQFAMSQESSLETDHDVYDWLRQSNTIDDHELPSEDTWKRYVRKARKAHGAQKNSPRIGNPTKSIRPQRSL